MNNSYWCISYIYIYINKYIMRMELLLSKSARVLASCKFFRSSQHYLQYTTFLPILSRTFTFHITIFLIKTIEGWESHKFWMMNLKIIARINFGLFRSCGAHLFTLCDKIGINISSVKACIKIHSNLMHESLFSCDIFDKSLQNFPELLWSNNYMLKHLQL